ncbi:MAG: PaaI family thioesterase [Actinomycetota bacterium]|nr:PaaI family thioesterase [Actinomycetota bacterium]
MSDARGDQPDQHAGRDADRQADNEATWLDAAAVERLGVQLGREPEPNRIAHERASDAVRRLIDVLHRCAAPAEAYEAVATTVEGLVEDLGTHPRLTTRGAFEHLASGSGDAAGGEALAPFSHFDLGALVGPLNAIAPPIHLRPTTSGVTGTVVFGDPYEGPPGHVHGGFVAAALDEVLGMAQGLSGRPGMTARLDVSYRRPTPLHRELELGARIVSVRGRKITVEGEVRHDGEVTAEATGLFISVDFEAMRAAMAAAEAAGSGDG